MLMVEKVQHLGRLVIQLCTSLGHAVLFLLEVLLRRPCWTRCLQYLERLSYQIYNIGVLSLPIIVVSALFIGMVLALQGHNILERFSAESQLGQLIALSVVRELGPVVTALLFAGRAGSAISSEIGLMQATDQLSSMEMMAVDPLGHILLPRLLAGFIAMPILTIIFNTVAIYGGYLLGVQWLGVDAGSFWSSMQSSVDFRVDVINGLIKSIGFGIVAIWIAVYQGFYTWPTAEGIGRATTRTVVYTSIAVLMLDFVLTALMIGRW